MDQDTFRCIEFSWYCKGGKRHPAQQYKSIEGVAPTTKGITNKFRGDCYNCVNSCNMTWDCLKPSKEDGGNSGQAREDAQIQINLAEETNYSNFEGFDMLLIGFKETIYELETTDANITGIERRILGVTDEQLFVNKGNNTQVLVKQFSPWWLPIDIQFTVNILINK